MKKLILGNFITADDSLLRANAVIVEDGIIKFVGDKDSANKLIDANTEVIDYKDNYIYPGFIETHCHGFFAGYRSKGQIDLTGCVGEYSTYIPVIKEYINNNPLKELYIAYGWNENNGYIDHKFLDDICSIKPLILNTAGGHSCLLNKKAMELFNITVDTVKKYGKTLVHTFDDGTPTGYICEEVAVNVLSNLPVSYDDAKDYILEWQNIAFKKGYTACCDAGSELIFKNCNEAYAQLQKEKKLKLRTYSFSLVKDNVDDPKDAINKIIDIKNKYDGEYFTTIGAKAFLDGVGEARTSWTVDEYNDEKNYYGLQRFADENKMVSLITEASNNNLAIHVHSEGDGATKFILECIKKSQDVTHNLDQRNLIAHLHFVKDEDFKNMASTNSIALVAPLWSPKFPGAYDTETKVFGSLRASNSYPIKSFLNAGAKVCFHSDYPISSLLDISRSFYMAETRRLPEEKLFNVEDTTNNIKESISRLQSLKAMTIDAAYALKVEDKLGSIKEGKIANLVVFDKDLINGEGLDILNTKTIATIVDGEIVYKA